MYVFWVSMAVCLVIIIASIYMVVTFALDLKKNIPAFKEHSEHLFGENAKTKGNGWTCAKWFVIGALVMFACLKMFLLPVTSLGISIAVQAAAVWFLSRNNPERKSMKRKWYALGAAAATLFFAILLVLEIGGSNDTKFIVQDFLILAALIVALVFADKKARVLENETEIRKTTGTITSIIRTSQSFLFIKYSKRVIYEYEFFTGGTIHKGIDGESERQMKKRGAELSNPAKVVYKWDEPSKSMLEGINHRKAVPVYLLIILFAIILAVHCVHSTDIVQTVINFRESIQQSELFNPQSETFLFQFPFSVFNSHLS